MKLNKIELQAKESELIAARKSVALTKQIQQTFELKVFLSILGVLILIIGFVLFRERKLKRKLAVANDKYHMLIVESNHRIKNNLQMVTSLIKYSQRGLDDNSKSALRDVSGKIDIISTLHKHLYVDVHNENVNLRIYFQEILSLYEDISPVNFQVKNEIDHINIRSERIVYFGLFFNEMLSNSIEHSTSDQLKIHMAVTPLKDAWLFIYNDSSNRASDVAVGTGTLLIEQLINRVDGVNYQFDPATGQYQFEFYVES